MTKSSNKRILRGLKVEGTTYCTPRGALEDQEQAQKVSEQNLKALEEFWYQKGMQEGEKKGYEQGFASGQEKGFEQGALQGKEEGQEEGRQAGFAEGQKSVDEQHLQEIENCLQSLQHAVEGIEREKQTLFKKLKPELIAFCITVCERVLCKKMQDPEVFAKVFDAVIDKREHLLYQRPIHVHLPKESYASTKEILLAAAKEKGLAGDHEIFFTEDAALQGGSFKVETEQSILSFNLNRILHELQLAALTEPTP